MFAFATHTMTDFNFAETIKELDSKNHRII